MGSNDVTQIIKGKRTKRQRSSSPCKVVLTLSSSSGYGVVEEYCSFSCPNTSSIPDIQVYKGTDEEEKEEEMAKCLILLAQGDGPIAIKIGTAKDSCVLSCGSEFTSGQAFGGHMIRHREKEIQLAIGRRKSFELKEQKRRGKHLTTQRRSNNGQQGREENGRACLDSSGSGS
ncbi:hypothetical protein Tsubulata_015580 [Turnera subulata]|uniref:C2H2-type domain-containing protein n=1 Tax=Turnera subulata TaxID=218843 RepID=A0A9Q0J9Y6_9ROSI|nr:hypothetical protein Tsubulata_015580 [Turnera subulata]